MIKGKSRYSYDIQNKLFTYNKTGDDPTLAVTKIMNRIKDGHIYPDPMTICNVTNLNKNNGSKKYFDSFRGIFRTSVFRNILDM